MSKQQIYTYMESVKILRDNIILLADKLDNKEELWAVYKTLAKAMSYLSAKHTMAEVKEENNHAN